MISQPGRANPPHIPDPELAALREQLRILDVEIIFADGGHTSYEQGNLDQTSIDQILVLFTAHQNALIDKVLGLIGEDLDYRGNSPEAMVNQFRAQLRAEVERLKQ